MKNIYVIFDDDEVILPVPEDSMFDSVLAEFILDRVLSDIRKDPDILDDCKKIFSLFREQKFKEMESVFCSIYLAMIRSHKVMERSQLSLDQSLSNLCSQFDALVATAEGNKGA